MNDAVLMVALRVAQDALDDFIMECMTADGLPKAPSRKAVMKARSMLPPRCRMALHKELTQKD